MKFSNASKKKMNITKWANEIQIEFHLGYQSKNQFVASC